MKYSIRLLSRENNRHEHDITIVFTDNGQRFEISTGISAKTKPVGCTFAQEEEHRAIKGARLAKIIADIEKYLAYNGQTSQEKKKKDLRAIITGTEQDSGTQQTLENAIRRFAQAHENKGTRMLINNTAAKIHDFAPDLNIGDVDKAFIRNLEQHLKKKGLAINSIARALRDVRATMNWLLDNNEIDRPPFGRLHIRQEIKPANALTAQQIADLRDFPVEQWQEIYRDLFMLSFYLCGINPADLLTADKITDNHLIYHRKKTGRLYDIPICEEAKTIIRKYKGKTHLLSPLDNYSNYNDFTKHWNKALKKIGYQHKEQDKAGKQRKIVYEPLFPHITVYSARYSFASIAADLDIPYDTIALCLGHAQHGVTARYIRYDAPKKIAAAINTITAYMRTLQGKK